MTTTLTSTPLASLLDRLFALAEAATGPATAGISSAERERWMSDETEYLSFLTWGADIAPVPYLGAALSLIVALRPLTSPSLGR